MSRIVIDGRLWGESGLGRYIRNLVFELQGLDGINRSNGRDYFILLTKKDFDRVEFTGSNFHKVLADFPWYSIGEQIQLLKLLRELKPDLVHFPHFNVPVFYRGKFVVTIHDLIHQHFQTREATTRNRLIYQIKKIGYQQVFKNAVRKSSRVIVPSKFVQNQLVSEWGVQGGKITVTYEGVEQNFLDLVQKIKPSDFNKISQKWGIEKPYLFYVGNAQPHKNLIRLIRVIEAIRKNDPRLQLVLSGPEHYFWEKIKKECGGKGIIFTGFVSEKELVTLYKNAVAYVFPSLEEGFGIPLLEAMACGCPVACSNAGSLSEVGGEAAVYFNPEDEEEMVRVIREIKENKGLKEKLTKKGKIRYKEFSWKKMARQTLEAYQEALE